MISRHGAARRQDSGLLKSAARVRTSYEKDLDHPKHRKRGHGHGDVRMRDPNAYIVRQPRLLRYLSNVHGAAVSRHAACELPSGLASGRPYTSMYTGCIRDTSRRIFRTGVPYPVRQKNMSGRIAYTPCIRRVYGRPEAKSKGSVWRYRRPLRTGEA